VIRGELFAGWMAVIADRLNRSVSEATLKAYHVQLSRSLDDETFERAAERIFRSARYWPSPDEFIQAAAGSDAQAQAVRAFEQVKRLGDHDPVTGPWFSERKIRELAGRAVAEAFIAAGASSAFASLTPEREPFVRKEFVGAYQRVTGSDPEAVIPAPRSAALPARVHRLVTLTARVLSVPKPGSD
jgi:hypothetical protein